MYEYYDDMDRFHIPPPGVAPQFPPVPTPMPAPPPVVAPMPTPPPMPTPMPAPPMAKPEAPSTGKPPGMGPQFPPVAAPLPMPPPVPTPLPAPNMEKQRDPFGFPTGDPPPGRPPFGGPTPGRPPFGGPSGGPPPGGPPTFIPQHAVETFAIDPGAIRRCLNRFVYIWLRNGEEFWYWPVFVGRTSISGWRWTGRRWIFFGVDLRSIQSFACF